MTTYLSYAHIFSRVNFNFSGLLPQKKQVEIKRPVEQERIFMFVDLNGSTTLAEYLGNVQYSLFLTTFFSDFQRCAEKLGAEIYQFVGDEVVVSWKFTQSNVHNAMQLVSSFKKHIQTQLSNYWHSFGFLPEFKIAIHRGRVAVSKIGFQKVYHGDTLNTCARLLELASGAKGQCIVSNEVAEVLTEHNLIPQKEIVLRGKSNPTKLFSVMV